jgi:hypothetical protein
MRLAVLLLGLLFSVTAAAAAQDALAVDSSGRSAAGITLRDNLPDDEVRELLRRYDVLPYEVILADPTPGFHRVPLAQASLGVIAEARARTARSAEAGPCHLIASLQDMRGRRNVRAAPGERESFARLRLSEIEAARTARERVLRGEGAVHFVTVVGRPENIRRLASDPRVRDITFGRLISNGGRQEFLVGRPRISRQQLPRTTPEVDALSDDEVEARLDRLVSDAPAECRDMLRNTRMNEPTARPQPADRGAYRAAGLVFRAEARLTTEKAVASQPANTRLPQVVRTVLTVTNPSDRRVEMGIRGCTLLLRAYRAGAGYPRSGSGGPVWDQARFGQCMQAPMRLSLGPGESRTFDNHTDERWILGESLPPGRYVLAALFRLADETLEIPAGELDLSNGLEGFAYRASTRLVGTTLHTTTSITNTTSRPVYLEYGDCALSVRAYRTPDRTGEPAWRSEFRASWAGGSQYVCLSYGATATVAPGATFQPREFQLTVPLIEILGDSLPDGRYYFSASLRLNFARTPEFPAGGANLSLPRQPLPASRMADAVMYRAATSVMDSAGPPTIRTVVTATLRDEGREIGRTSAALQRFSRACPVVLYAYRDRARRDAAPLSGAADWTSGRDCGGDLQEMVLQGGMPRTFEVRASARDILGDRLPPGRYYFVAVVRTEGRPVYLAAGDAELGR